ncbi:MAG: type II toxin-antitoxin system PemK/MazF family toxin [Vulcanococcus sp.]
MPEANTNHPQRGRLYTWPRNRAFGDSKARPVLVISPDAATCNSSRWVVIPISTDARLVGNSLAVPLAATVQTGLQQASHAMAWLPTTVEREQLAGPLGRISSEEMRAVLQAIQRALDLAMDEPWVEGSTND